MAIIDDTKTELTVRRNKIVDKYRDIQTKRGKSLSAFLFFYELLFGFDFFLHVDKFFLAVIEFVLQES